MRQIAPAGGLLSGGYDEKTLDRLGRGVPNSRFLHLASTLQRAAAELYARSSEGGYRDGICALGALYEKGLGVRQDTDQAVKLYRLAAERGSDRAKEALRSLEGGSKKKRRWPWQK